MKKFLITIAPFFILLFLFMLFLWGMKGVLVFFGEVLLFVVLVFGVVKWMDFVDKHIKDGCYDED